MSKTTDSPSLASATGTLLDSACKHIQQCRVSYDHMLHFVTSSDELEKREKDYCVHKDEMVVGVARPWKKTKTRQLPPSAYPRVVSNLGNIYEDDYKLPRNMIKFLFHFSSDILTRHLIIEDMSNPSERFDDLHIKGADLNDRDYYFAIKDGAERLSLEKHLAKMHDYYPVGISNTLGYAHPNSGDTMSSVMIGGLRTVMNGDWEIQTGDKIQWYWTFERDCFRDEDGSRKSYKKYNKDGNVVVEDYTGCDPSKDYGDKTHEPDTVIATDSARKQFHDRQYGIKPGSLAPGPKSKAVARIKAHVKGETTHIYDDMRVFAKAIGAARPNELVDIQICRQSM